MNDFDPRETLKLVGHDDTFNYLKKLIINEKFPKVLLLSGDKGIGKLTLINHFMHFYFDKSNYDENKKIILNKGRFHNQMIMGLYSNIFYLNNSNKIKIKVDNIRKLKDDLSKSSIFEDKRFIILDEVESFNINSLNALLKVIEDNSSNNYFILINNKTQPLLETIKSRCFEIKITLRSNVKDSIIKFLIDNFNIKKSLDYNLVKTSPGNFLRFNYLLIEKKINLEKKFLINFNHILNFYKKEKDTIYKDFILFLAEYYLQRKKFEEYENVKKIGRDRSLIFRNINDFFVYNLNQNYLMNSLENTVLNE